MAKLCASVRFMYPLLRRFATASRKGGLVHNGLGPCGAFSGPGLLVTGIFETFSSLFASLAPSPLCFFRLHSFHLVPGLSYGFLLMWINITSKSVYPTLGTFPENHFTAEPKPLKVSFARGPSERSSTRSGMCIPTCSVPTRASGRVSRLRLMRSASMHRTISPALLGQFALRRTLRLVKVRIILSVGAVRIKIMFV